LRVDVPEDLQQPQALGDAIHDGVVQFVGRAEEVNGTARLRLDFPSRSGQLPRDLAWGEGREDRVRIGVIADRSDLELAGKIAAIEIHAATDDEEGRALVRAGELPEGKAGVGAGSVVKGQRDLVATGTGAVDGQAEAEQAPDRRAPGTAGRVAQGDGGTTDRHIGPARARDARFAVVTATARERQHQHRHRRDRSTPLPEPPCAPRAAIRRRSKHTTRLAPRERLGAARRRLPDVPRCRTGVRHAHPPASALRR
jgi:hypothetical protein